MLVVVSCEFVLMSSDKYRFAISLAHELRSPECRLVARLLRNIVACSSEWHEPYVWFMIDSVACTAQALVVDVGIGM